MENFNSEAEKLEQIEKILNDFRAELDKFEDKGFEFHDD